MQHEIIQNRKINIDVTVVVQLTNNFLLKSSQQPISLILICNIDTTVENKYSTLKKQKKTKTNKKAKQTLKKNYNNNKTLLVPWFCLETGKARALHPPQSQS